jgi:hypothetical protein
MKKAALLTTVILSLVLWLGPAAPDLVGLEELRGLSSSAPAMFVENAGQFPAAARFQLRGAGPSVWLADNAIWITLLAPAAPDLASLKELRGLSGSELAVNLRLSFPGAGPAALEPFRPLTTTVSYFTGRDPSHWRPALPVWGGVRYVNLYPGLDLELAAGPAGLGLRLVCRQSDGCPAALAALRLRVEGAEAVFLDGDHLRLQTVVGDFHLPLPVVVDPQGQPLPTAAFRPVVCGDVVSTPFAGRPQPVTAARRAASGLHYGTFLGGAELDEALSLAVDDGGRAIVAGITLSTDFPTTPGAYNPTINGGLDVFVSRLNAAGSDLEFSTFLGGGGYDNLTGLALDPAGNIYLAGYTDSADYPVTAGAFDPTFNGGGQDTFVSKLSADGSALLYSTYLGGGSLDWGYALAVDGQGSAYVTGGTVSADFPTTPGAYDPTHNNPNNYDVFVTRLNPAGSALVFSTFLGAYSDDRGHTIAIDPAGGAIVAGTTYSYGFPTTPGAYDTTYNGTEYSDSFVTRFNAAGSALVFSTFLGGTMHDDITGLAIDPLGGIFVTGSTESEDFSITPGAFDPTFNGGLYDAFAARFDPGGSDLIYSTFLGGGLADFARAVAVDAAGRACVAGQTGSSDFPVTLGAFDVHFNDRDDAFVACLTPGGDGLIYASYLGGTMDEYAYGVAADPAGDIYLAGWTTSVDFPTTAGAFDTSHNGQEDGFVVKLPAAASGYFIYLPVASKG